jgi:hypothetical protein
VKKATYGPAAVRIGPNEQAAPVGMWFIVGERLALKEFDKAPPPLGGIHGFEAGRKRLSSRIPAQGEYLRPIEQQLNRAAQPSPELNLSGNGALHDLSGYASVQHQAIRKLYCLAHSLG